MSTANATTYTPPRHGLAYSEPYQWHSRNPHYWTYAPKMYPGERGSRVRKNNVWADRSRKMRANQLADRRTRLAITTFGISGDGGTLRPGRREITKFRRLLKQAVRVGGHFHIDVGMEPPTEQDAQAIMAMARGVPAGIAKEWGRRGEWRGAGFLSRTITNPFELPTIYRRDPDYEARIAAWAARFLPDEAVAA